MNNILQTIFIGLLLLIFIYVVDDSKNKQTNTFSSYYNTQGAFAGFIQKKKNLFRACEFSTNGSILSCTKWFNDNTLTKGKNEGIFQEDI